MLGQIVIFTVLPSLLLCAIAPLVGQRYPVSDALVHSALLVAGSFGLFGLTMFLRQVLTDVPAYVAVGAILFLVAFVTFMVKDVTPYSFFRLMNGADYFFARQVPWMGLATSVGLGSALVWLSFQLVEKKDF